MVEKSNENTRVTGDDKYSPRVAVSPCQYLIVEGVKYQYKRVQSGRHRNPEWHKSLDVQEIIANKLVDIK